MRRVKMRRKGGRRCTTTRVGEVYMNKLIVMSFVFTNLSGWLFRVAVKNGNADGFRVREDSSFPEEVHCRLQ